MGAVAALCGCGLFTGVILLLLPSGSAGAAGKRAVSLCCLLEMAKILLMAVKGGMGW